MNLVITLPLRNQDQRDQLLEDLYDPTSPSYRQFLTVEQFTAQFGPTQQDYDAVINFAQENNLTVVGTSPNRLIVRVSGTAANVEAAFHVNLNVYRHPTENRTFYAPDREPTTGLTFSLWHITGLDNFSLPHPAGLSKNPAASGPGTSATTGSGPSASFLGSDMRAAYYGGSLTGSGQSVGLLEYLGTDLADLNTYFTNIGQTNSVPILLVSTDGTSTSCVDSSAGGNCDDLEQTIDMTQALGMAPDLSSLVMYIGSTDAAIFNAMATAKPLNAQLSSSWTWYPADPATDDPFFVEFAAQGQNLFQAAGDSAKWTTSGTGSEIYPADDVYVTSVGGTDLQTTAAGGAWSSESAWANSGGGISPHKLAIPSWQTAAAAGCASCSQSYRNGPDVSANANYTFYVCADQTTCTANEWGGTSFAAPMWAGYLALVNQQSVTNGNNTLGFINPSLYTIGAGRSYTTDFHDITSGSNGYSATTGYGSGNRVGQPEWERSD
jgi:kumamolisin